MGGVVPVALQPLVILATSVRVENLPGLIQVCLCRILRILQQFKLTPLVPLQIALLVKKVWVQVVWTSPSGNFSAPKGCFIIAYSQDAPTLPPKIEYNPFLPEQFVRDRAISYYLFDGDRFRGLRDNDWKNLESVSGWDKGCWKS